MNLRQRAGLAVVALAAAASLASCSGGTGTVNCAVDVGPSPAPSNAVADCTWVTNAPVEPTTDPTDPPPTSEPTDPPTSEPTQEPTDPPPTVDPTIQPEDPSAPCGPTDHGECVNFSNVGAGDTTGFTTRAGGNITTPSNLSNTIFNGNVTLRANLTCNHCVFNGDGGTVSSNYAVRMTAAQNTPEGTVFECNYCEFNAHNPVAKNIGATSGYGVYLYRSIVRGGGDGIHLNLFPNATAARVIDGHTYQGAIIESFVVYSDRVGTGHTDAIQFEGAANPAPGYLVKNSRVQGCNPPFSGTNWCTTADGDTIANAAIISTYPGTAGHHTRIDILNSCVIGGNYEIFMEDVADVNNIVNNRTGGTGHYRYGSILPAAGANVSGNEIGGCEVIQP